MQLLIVRHGIAEEHSVRGDDASRRLTDEGIEKTTQAAKGLVAIADAPDVMLSSPKVRAMQTAQILGQEFDRMPKELAALGGESVEAIVQAITHRREARVMVVGHEPTLSHTAAHLCTGGTVLDFIELKKSGCICLDVPIQAAGRAGRATMLWMATPKMLRAAGKD